MRRPLIIFAATLLGTASSFAQMPEMDGPTLLKELRKKSPKLKIIFVSGYPNEAFDASLDRSQHFAFLPKPFSLPQLAAKVKEELARAE